jgi:hypothetical protein
MGPSYRLSLFRRSVNIPAAGASAVSPGAVDGGDLAPLLPAILFYVQSPSLTAGQLPDGETITYTLVEGNDPAFASPTSSTVMGVQTGAGGAGAAAAIFAAPGKFQGGKYVGLKITASAGANAAGVSITLAIAQT